MFIFQLPLLDVIDVWFSY